MFRANSRMQAVYEFVKDMEVGDMEEFDVIDPDTGGIVLDHSARVSLGVISKKTGVKFKTLCAPSKKAGAATGCWRLWVIRIA